MTFFSPLEQFELVVYIPFIADSFFDFSFTNSALAIFLSFISTVILIKAVGKGFVVPSRLQPILKKVELLVYYSYNKFLFDFLLQNNISNYENKHAKIN